MKKHSYTKEKYQKGFYMPSKLRNILIIGFTHTTGGGGGNIHFNNLIPSWQSAGIEISLFNPVKAIKFNLSSVIKSTLQSIFVKIDNLYEMNNCDIIVSQSPYPPDIILAFRLSRKYMKPIAVYVHHITPGISIHPFRRGIFRVILNVVYISSVLYFFKKFRIPIFLDNPNTLKHSKISVFPDLDAVMNKELNYTPHETRPDMDYDICYIGRIENHKGIEDVIRVVKILKNKYSLNLRVVLAGKGKNRYVAKIRKMINKSGLSESVLLKGYVSDEQKYELLKKSKIFLFLSYEEGWALSVMEAASIGTPIVAYSLPAYYYLRGNYFPVELGNTQLCAETVKQVLDDNASAMKKATKAKECVDKYSYDFIAKQQLIFFRRIVHNYRANYNR